MSVNESGEAVALSRAGEEVARLQTALQIAKLLQPHTCLGRKEIRRSVYRFLMQPEEE